MRIQITEENVRKAVTATLEKMNERLKEKGAGTFASKHEILGVVQEEVLELTDAVRGESQDDVVAELLDIAVAAIYGVACIQAGATDW